MAANPKGQAGEDFAARILERDGCQILARNYHSRYGEIDLIAVKDGVIAFVEVKTRRRGSMVTGAQALTPSKQRKIITTALQYLSEHPQLDLQPRFDLFSVVTGHGGVPAEYEHLMGAFDGEAYTR